MLNRLHEVYHHGKKTIGNMWNHATKFAGQIDHAMGIGKRIFSVLQPAIQDMGGGNFNQSVMRGIQGYEHGREQVMGHHNKVQATLSQLRRAAPEIDL